MHNMDKLGKTISGAQSVMRALSLLKLIGAHHEAGIEQSELIAATQLERSTTYRLLQGLVQAGFVQRDVRKRYRLGIEAMQIGLAAMSRAPILETCRPAMQAIARHTEDTVYLVVRNGDYGHCLHVELGAFPIHTVTMIVGALRLLGRGAGGQALLATLSDDELNALYDRHSKSYRQDGLSLAKLREIVRRTRNNHHAYTENIVTEGVSGVGVAFSISSSGYAAISVGAIRQRMPSSRRDWIAALISEEVTKLGFNTHMARI
ncbi:IclR family transcriptional regulator (plasmid) [Cupriavidus taiwanensis]|uniref:IclR family transcriptional regulator n=1 Tax=Cupriavidus taiwanensis TaxID=164546 RepID=A0A9Q7UUP5_9BURK|nr:IclR family transcriptional regulator [Cupriavidus taiwanensis]SPD67584.1 IclR family transcriptional regulator [Cupriavidus taiwanensis]